MDQEVLFRVLKEIPTGIFVFDKNWHLIFTNEIAISDINVPFEKIKDHNWINLLIKHNSSLKEHSFRRLLQMFWSNSITNRLIKMMISEDTYLIFLTSIKKIIINEIIYHVVILRETTKEHKSSLIAIQFYKRFRRDLKIVKNFQKVINNSIIEKIIGKDYIFKFYSKFIPSGELSGDLINVTQISRRYFSVFLGDGRGHGLPAALYSPLIYSYISRLSLEVNSGKNNLANLINHINLLAYEDFTKGGEYYFFSGIFILVDCDKNCFSIVNAGHPIPFYRDSNQKIRKLSNHGSLIGVSKNSKYNKVDFKAADGQIFLLYTDGLIQNCRKDDPMLKVQDIFRFLGNYTQKKLNFNNLHNQIFESKIGDEAKNCIKDDISILVMQIEKK